MEADGRTDGPVLHGRLSRLMYAVCLGVALFGGAAMVAGMLVVVASVIGGLFDAPIFGETEIVSMAIAVAVFCFLPYCHLLGQNIVVDFFSKPLPRWMIDWLDVVMNLAFALVAGFLGWRLVEGGITAYRQSSYSMFLRLPEWPTYLVGSIASVLWVLVALFVSFEALLRAGGRLPPARRPSEFG